MSFPTTVAIGDAHLPWINWRTVERIADAVAQIRPKVIIQMGDLRDQYSWTRFPRTHCLYTPLQEYALGMKGAVRFWALMRKVAGPRCKLVQLLGNHDIRPYKRMQEIAPELEPMLDMKTQFTFDGVETIHDPREDFLVGNVAFTHGFRKHGHHVLHTRRNTVVGHLHVGGVVYVRHGRQTLWELNAGMCADPSSIPMSYAALRRYNNTTQGFGLIRDMCREAQPSFIHLPNP